MGTTAAQIGNLLFGRLAVGSALNLRSAAGRLEIGDTADWKSLRYTRVA